MENEVKKRGRPRLVLTPDEVEERKQKRRDYQNQWAKNNPEKIKQKWKNFSESHKEKIKENEKKYRSGFYFPKIYLKKENKTLIEEYCKKNGVSLKDFFINAIETVYKLKIKK